MRVGIIGFGEQARANIVPCCLAIPGVEIPAICDVNQDRCNDAKARYGSTSTYTDFRQMMDECSLDAVVAACYPDDHYEIAMEALSRRLPIFVEKPPAPSSRHLKTMIELAAANRCTTGVGMNFRFADVTRRLKQISRGKIESISLRHFANKPIKPLWNQVSMLKSFLYAQTIHSVDFLVDLCGRVRNISVEKSGNPNSIILTIILLFENGAHCALTTSNTSPHFTFDFDAICRANVHISARSLWEMTVTEVGKPYHQNEHSKWSDLWAPSPLVSGFRRSGYEGQFQNFFDSVANDEESSVSFRSMEYTYECLDMIEKRLSCLNDVMGNESDASKWKTPSKPEYQL